MNKILVLAALVMVSCSKGIKVKVDDKVYDEGKCLVLKSGGGGIKEVMVFGDSLVGIAITEGDKDIVGYYSEEYNFWPLDSSYVKELIVMLEKDRSELSNRVSRLLYERLWQDRETFVVDLSEGVK